MNHCKQYIKHTFILALMGLILPFTGDSQALEISPVAGYMFGGGVRVYEGEASIEDKLNYGGSIGFEVAPLTYAELTYFRQDSRVSIQRYGIFDAQTEFDLATSYYHIGMLRESQGGEIRPFGLVSFGATVYNPKEPGRSTATFFSTIFGGGVKAYLSEQVGIRLQGRIMFPIAFSSGSLWCGTGGCGLGYSSYATIVQGDFSGGIFIHLDR